MARVLVAATVALAAVAGWDHLLDPFGVPKATVVVVGTLLVLVAAAVEVLRRPTIVVRGSKVGLLLLAFAAVVVVSTVLAPHPLAVLVGGRPRNAGAATYLACAALCLHLVRRADERSARVLALGVVGAAAVVAGIACAQVVGGRPVTSTMGNIDFASGWLAVALPLCLWGALSRGNRDEVGLVAGGVGVLTVVALVRCGAFQGVVAGAAGALVVLGAWAVERGHHRRVRRAHLLAAGVVVVVALAVAAPNLRHQLDDGLHERRYFWTTAVGDVLDRPVLGHGLDTFDERWYRLRPTAHAEQWPNRNAGAAHDVPLDIAMGGGLLLLGLYLALVAVTGRRLVRGLRSRTGEARLLLAGLGGAWVAYLVQSLVSIDVPALAVAHWALMGTIVGLTAGAGRVRTLPRAAAVAVLVGALAAAVPALLPLRSEVAIGDALAAERRGDERTAVARLHHAADLAPWSALPRAFLAVRVPDDEALRLAVRAAELSPGDPYAAAAAADAAAAAGDDALARRWRAAARHDDPHNPRWR